MTKDASAQARWAVSWPLFSIGAVAVIAGGLVAAATAPSPSEHGSWAAAYLVLVGGVAQIGLAAGQAALSARPVPGRVIRLEAVSWNVANALVIAGTLTGSNAVVYAGGALLVIALAMFGQGVRESTNRYWLLYAFRALVVLLLVSIPTGLVLATVRGGS